MAGQGLSLLAEKRFGRFGPMSEAGAHEHGLDRKGKKTLEDGPHDHLFELPGGAILFTEMGGVHEHKHTDDGNKTLEDGPHKHQVRLPNGDVVWTDVDGPHEHDLLVGRSAFDGTHVHSLTLPDGTKLTSITAGEFAERHKGIAKNATPALSLTLDEEAQGAFLRLASGLPVLAERLGKTKDLVAGLGEDLVTDAQRVDDPVSLTGTIEDLETCRGQVKDEGTRKRIADVLLELHRLTRKDEFAVPQTKGKHFKVRRGGPGYEVFDADTGSVVASFTGSGPAHADADRRNGVSKFQILKQEEERTVFGIVLEPETKDSQTDIYSEDEIRKSAYRFMEEFQRFGLMHKKIVPSILPLESYLAPVDFEAGGQKVVKGTWVLRVRVLDDEIWKDVKSGKLTGFSIGGSAIRRPEGAAA